MPIAFTVCVTFFAYHVCGVVGHSSEKQMIRIYTRGIIAFMADLQTIWYGAIVQFIAVTVGRHRTRLWGAYANLTVSVALYCAMKYPALIRIVFLYLVPKLNFGIDKWFPLPSVRANEPGGLAFFVTIPHGGSLANRDNCAASTLAFTIRCAQAVSGNPGGIISYVVGKVWGMIGVHKNLHFLRQAWDVSRVAGHFLLGCYSSNYSINYPQVVLTGVTE